MNRSLGRSSKFVEQRLRVFQIGSVEALGEPVVDVGERRARFERSPCLACSMPLALAGKGLSLLQLLHSHQYAGMATLLLGTTPVLSPQHFASMKGPGGALRPNRYLPLKLSS